MYQAEIAYRRNERPRRGLAAAGAIFCIKAILLIPHLIIVGVLGYLAYAVGYVGFWIVAFTGELPRGLQDLVSMWLRWGARAYGWLVGITDEYAPFEPDPQGFPIDARTPVNQDPSKGWAIAGIFVFPKAICAIPHLFLLYFTLLAAAVVTWVGYLAVLFTGKFPAGMQDFIAGTMQWYTRLFSWFFGLTDEYPPFGTRISPVT